MQGKEDLALKRMVVVVVVVFVRGNDILLAVATEEILGIWWIIP
jgi:hypothetical protein